MGTSPPGCAGSRLNPQGQRSSRAAGDSAITHPQLSVVIPAYNGAETIHRSIDTATAQTFQDIEVAVVDDGSTDQTADIVRRIADERIRLLSHDTNQGTAAARNTGIAAARGTYIAFLDADDEWLPRKLERQLDFLQGLPSGIGAVTTGFFLHRIEAGSVVTREPRAENGWLREFLDACTVAPGSTLVAHRAIFEEVGGYEPLPRYEDWDWLLRVINRYPFHCLPEPLAKVHRRGWPEPETVDQALTALRRRQEPRVVRLAGRHGLRRFRASIEIERAIARFHAGEWFSMAARLGRATTISPSRAASFAHRAYERQRGRV